MSLSRILIVVIAVGLSACAATKFMVDGRTFGSAEEALSHTKQTLDQRVATIQPLSMPIAGPGIVVTPPKAHAKNLILAASPNIEANILDYLVEAADLNWSLFPAQVERRNIFQNLVVLRATSLDGISAPPNGYLLWLEAPTRDSNYIHIAAAGDRKTTEIKMGRSVTDPVEAVRLMLKEIEDFAR